MSSEPAGPLKGLKVLELAHVMAGPMCGRMLADLGASVVKLERPGGEDSRTMAPPWIGGESAAFLMMNRNKRGICVDLKTEGGRAIVRRLALDADVIIENFRYGALNKLGLGYDDLRAINPRLIWAEISGFGRTGPYAARGGYDLIAQGMSGLMSITGEGPGRPPIKVGAPVADITAGILAALGVAAAVVERARTGRGQRVDTSIFEAAITMTLWHSAMALSTGVSPQAMGTAHPLDAPYQAYEAADGWFNLGAANQANWLRLLGVLAREDLQQDARFCDNPARVRNLAELTEELQPVFRRRTVAEWMQTLESAGVPCGPILSIDQMLADPQVLARKMRVTTQHATLGEVETIGNPIKLSGAEPPGPSSAPILGQHTLEVLRESGYGATEIQAFLEERAVFAAN
jgi:crotonobetainyl-CoA:carnitine CoA-transferase CaiB-like acyl-CoA transferase